MATSIKYVDRFDVNYIATHFDENGDFGMRKVKMKAVLKKEKTFKIISTPDKLKDIETTVLKEMEDETYNNQVEYFRWCS